ncbi:hypothetical protein V1264_009412 [Littorina saxatilis]|uniref:Uncharacterized protein n=1 Tax=Littorina saxatilis TaxID=31220 RepID=A0AAN9ARC6_9CAEN
MFAKGLLDLCKQSWQASVIIAFPGHTNVTPTNSNNSQISQENDRREEEADLEEEPQQGPPPQRPTSPEAGSDEGASQSSQRADLTSAVARSEQGNVAAEAQPNTPGFDQQMRRHGGGGRPCDRARVPGIYRQFLGGSDCNCAPCVDCLGFRFRRQGKYYAFI